MSSSSSASALAAGTAQAPRQAIRSRPQGNLPQLPITPTSPLYLTEEDFRTPMFVPSPLYEAPYATPRRREQRQFEMEPRVLFPLTHSGIDDEDRDGKEEVVDSDA